MITSSFKEGSRINFDIAGTGRFDVLRLRLQFADGNRPGTRSLHFKQIALNRICPDVSGSIGNDFEIFVEFDIPQEDAACSMKACRLDVWGIYSYFEPYI